jgi:hypothetical protein
MTRFQLVFRHADGDWSEIRESNLDGEPHINGELIVDGRTYAMKGVGWIVRTDDIGDSMRRFVCTVAHRDAKVRGGGEQPSRCRPPRRAW